MFITHNSVLYNGSFIKSFSTIVIQLVEILKLFLQNNWNFINKVVKSSINILLPHQYIFDTYLIYVCDVWGKH